MDNKYIEIKDYNNIIIDINNYIVKYGIIEPKKKIVNNNNINIVDCLISMREKIQEKWKQIPYFEYNRIYEIYNKYIYIIDCNYNKIINITYNKILDYLDAELLLMEQDSLISPYLNLNKNKDLIQ